MKWFFVVLVLSVGLFAKDKSIDDYPLLVTVKNNTSSPMAGMALSGKPTLTVTDGHFYYNLSCSALRFCYMFQIGSQFHARIVGDRLEGVGTGRRSEKLKTFGYHIDATIPVETMVPQAGSSAAIVNSGSPTSSKEANTGNQPVSQTQNAATPAAPKSAKKNCRSLWNDASGNPICTEDVNNSQHLR